MSEERRIDQWLWFARFFKSRTQAGKLCAGNRVRVNREIVRKASRPLRIGDVLTFPQGRDVRVVRVLDLGARRGPAAEAQTLYEDLAPVRPRAVPEAASPSGGQRPTKRDRRAIEEFISRQQS